MFRSLMFVSALFVTFACRAGELPVVIEEVDSIILLSSQNTYQRIIFIKNGQVLATRLALDDMLWTVQGKYFVLVWQDHWTASRVVKTKTFISMVGEYYEPGANGPWWNQAKNMRDLKQPE